ncbi:hypothetical protein [Desulfovibrio sp. Fe33]|uniref:hypothetical protein n=1 Tax=Desulfovibrio sp. Fe33 TaxID=3020842 RepID=UPI00234D0FFE|nr:hypothetical protein [Desulfovibrio sp. Fe33]
MKDDDTAVDAYVKLPGKAGLTQNAARFEKPFAQPQKKPPGRGPFSNVVFEVAGVRASTKGFVVVSEVALKHFPIRRILRLSGVA